MNRRNVPKKEFNQVLKDEKKERRDYYEAKRGEDVRSCALSAQKRARLRQEPR